MTVTYWQDQGTGRHGILIDHMTNSDLSNMRKRFGSKYKFAPRTASEEMLCKSMRDAIGDVTSESFTSLKREKL